MSVLYLIPAFIVVAAIGVGYFVVKRIARRGAQVHALAQSGELVSGTVTRLEKIRKNRAGHHEFFMTYEFAASDGSVRRRRLEITPSDFGALAEGQRIDLLYLPQSPGVSATTTTVDQMRRALQLPETEGKSLPGGRDA